MNDGIPLKEDIKLTVPLRFTSNTCVVIALLLTLVLTITGCSAGGNGNSTGNHTVDANRDSYNSGPAFNGSVTLKWLAPEANADGSTLSDLGGFRIYYGKNSNGYYDYSLDVGNATGAAINNLSSGTWCFALTAYDMAGNESDYSPGVCKNVESQE